jgi:hypothetical protein
VLGPVLRTRPALLALGVAFVVLGYSSAASAYCRSRSCENEWSVETATHFQIPCVMDQQECWAFGPPLHWRTNCVSFSVQRDGSSKSAIDLELAEAVIEAAFDAWTEVDCGGGETPSFSVRNAGAVDCARVEYNQDEGNANVFFFRDDSWPHPIVEGGDVLALTTTTYNVDTGEILDADVEFNTQRALFTTTDVENLADADFLAIATHEIGHFLGLAHTLADPTATMWKRGYDALRPFEMRTPKPDDIAGVCAIYPPGEPLSSSCPIRHGFSETCGTPAEDEGCSIGAAPGRSTTGVATGLALFALSFALRRLRRARAR